MTIANYQTFIFDCDGVVLNSNKVKTEAFYQAALPYGEAAAQQLVNYHVERGGISRYKKFEWFVEQLCKEQKGPTLAQLLETYAIEVRNGLLSCEIAQGLAELRSRTQDANWLIVSGGDQQELRDVFTARGIAHLFDGGIFGSPDTKDTILAREKASGNIRETAVFLGDSRYDHVAASNAQLDFIFLHQWSEFEQWPQYCTAHHLTVVESINQLL